MEPEKTEIEYVLANLWITLRDRETPLDVIALSFVGAAADVTFLARHLPDGVRLLAERRVDVLDADRMRDAIEHTVRKHVGTYSIRAAESNDLERTVRSHGRQLGRIERLLEELIGREKTLDGAAPRPRAEIRTSGGVVLRTVSDEGARSIPPAVDWSEVAARAPTSRAHDAPVPVDFSTRPPDAKRYAGLEDRAGQGLDNVRSTSMNVGEAQTSIETIGADGALKKESLPRFGDSLGPRSDIR